MSKNSIKEVWLDPKVEATPQAIEAINNADFIVYCPGSLYGSIIANFLPTGIQEALKSSGATKILITNIVSNRNQTHKFTLLKYFKVFQKYTGLTKPFDIVIAPDLSQKSFERKFPKVAKSYNREHAHFIGWSKTDIKNFAHKDIKVITSDIFSITPKLNRLRHDPERLAKIFQKIIK
jgi:uncharacterized cofD-like protein